MSSNLVIAAIPDEDDRVWKISSEKIPHLTILFLGDSNKVANLEQIMQFVQHAAETSLKRFDLLVDHRGELGEDKADVLFFKQGYGDREIRDFRSTLLQDQNIKTAYDSSPQFDGGWKPHMTLGYPDTPAKSIPEDHPKIFDVQFNKIAVWTGDFQGPDFLLKDYWDEMNEPAIPMDIAMSALTHATTVSDTPWSHFKDSDYDDAQYARACLLDRGKDAGTAKQRYGIPVREPNGTVNRNACHAAAAVLSSKGGTGSARGTKVKGSSEQIAAAKKKLVSLYKSALNEDVPKGLMEASMQQTAELGIEFISHHGVKGQKWGVRKQEVAGGGHIRISEKSNRALPSTNVTAAVVGTALIMPPLVPLAFVSRRVRSEIGAARTHNKTVRADKKFEKKVMSANNFVAIHNGSTDHFHREIGGINAKYPMDLTKNPAKQRAYDTEVMSMMQNAYRESANKIVNKSGTRSLDVEFKNDGLDFKITTKPVASKVKHGITFDDNDVLTITGKIKRDSTGHIVGFEFDDFKTDSLAQTADLGAEFLSHYGVKGMQWGVRKQGAVTTQAHIDSGILRRQTKVQAKGGEAHPPAKDAVKAAVNRQKLKKSGVTALSNAELRELQTRIQLEMQVKQLMTSKGQKLVTKQLEEEGKQQLSRGVRKAATSPSVAKKVRRTAATVATTAALL